MLNRVFCLPATLIVGVTLMVGCNPAAVVDNSGGDAATNENSSDPTPVPSDGDTDPGADPGNDDPSGDQDGGTPTPSVDALSDFTAADVNTASARYQEDVSPRDYLGNISAWYFGHST